VRDLQNSHAIRDLGVLLMLGAVVSTAHADAIGTSYSVADLGSATPALSTSNGTAVPVDLTSVASGGFATALWTAANGGQFTTVTAGGASYPFTFTPAAALTAYHGIMASFPPPAAPPVNDPNTYGNPVNAYSVLSSPLMNANGIVAAINAVGVYGHYGTESAYYIQRNADGSWGSPVGIWSGALQFAQGPNVGGATLAGINNLNQILGTMSVSNGVYSSTDAVLYNIGTHSLTNLSTLPALAGYLNIQPIAIDDLGRILVAASPIVGSPLQGEQYLLLTPSDPQSSPVPEPGSIAVLTLAIVAFAVRKKTGQVRF
jgi:hypothetical protein